MKIHGWGRYPVIEAEVISPFTRSEWIDGIKESTSIARGLGRSYGDSAIGAKVFQTDRIDHYIALDETQGILACEAGISINEILRLIVPKGWFMPVTPGTSHVTVGGVIASDVHGKNHPHDGTFTQHVQSLDLLLGTGEIVSVSKTHLPELFHATCGGMGLTGVILSASFKLKPVCSSQIQQTTIKTGCLEELLEQFEANQSSTYSVAWLDCLARGAQSGRSLLMLGEHAGEGPPAFNPKGSLNIPLDMPPQILNAYSMRLFNALHYANATRKAARQTLPLEPYFYPLDKLGNWNRLYGKQGFIQYQFVLPKNSAATGLHDILKIISDSGKNPFLAVLKTFGAGNQNMLSFPVEGYTLAVDFKADGATFELVRKLDAVVIACGGRIYLAKDALMAESTFKACYPEWQKFEEVRATYGAIGKFSSCQSKRLGLQ